MINMQISSLLKGYTEGRINVSEVIDYALERMEDQPDEVWISKLSRAEIDKYIKRIEGGSPETLPLYGIPFVIKDNIDLSGVVTTAGCPDYSYMPEKSAFVVEQLISTGAIPLAKTNLDQFATGLVGTRSPYGACPNSFNSEYISGGSSSGSAVAVASGCCSFALGTDTAGSGRVPASFNNLIGLKPSKGLLSCSGVVPACKSLDCVSIFALDSNDAAVVLKEASKYDRGDCYARELGDVCTIPEEWSFGVPRMEQLKFFGDDEYEEAFRNSIDLAKQCGGRMVEIDFQPFIDAANLLYSGPWVNERYVAVGEFIKNHKESVLDTTALIIESGLNITAPEVFEAMYKMQGYKNAADEIMCSIDCLLTPTSGTCYKISEVNENPIEFNTNLGFYTNYMNLFDYAAVAVPTAITSRVPFGVTLVSFAGHDRKLLKIADILHHASGMTLGVSKFTPSNYSPADKDATVDLAVCGAHLNGYPLNSQLIELGANFVGAARSASEYRMFAFEDGGIAKPGLIHDAKKGASIYLEIFRLSIESFGKFVNMIPAPLGIGKILLDNGDRVAGFIAEAEVASIGNEITDIGDWRSYVEDVLN